MDKGGTGCGSVLSLILSLAMSLVLGFALHLALSFALSLILSLVLSLALSVVLCHCLPMDVEQAAGAEQRSGGRIGHPLILMDHRCMT